MTRVLPVVITILHCKDGYLFIKRRKAPYEGLWALVGGKVNLGEHIRAAALREVMEETSAPRVQNYDYRGFVSERLLDSSGSLLSYFLIFVGYAEIEDYIGDHAEGELAVFSRDDIETKITQFVPSDWYMFRQFVDGPETDTLYEVELVQDDGYHLNYFRRAED
ncbi:MAG: NUDIX domain-containing protein [Candidatus Thorarchaeota archaeon]